MKTDIRITGVIILFGNVLCSLTHNTAVISTRIHSNLNTMFAGNINLFMKPSSRFVIFIFRMAAKVIHL